MENALSWLLDRLKEKTTWTGIIGLVGTLLGRQFAPEFADAITTAGIALTSVVLMVVKEKKAPPAP